ncbi:MAG: hypothetical protein NVS1B13_23350 [Flavisolibacter sp.]
MYNVLIATLANWDTLTELPYILKKGGCAVDILCKKNDWLKANNHYNHWIESEQDPQKLSKQLIDLVQENWYDWIILGDEPLIKLMNEAVTDEELFKKILPLTKIENRNVLSSKVGLSDFCQNNGINSPKYTKYDGVSDPKDFKVNLSYPVIVKKDLSWGGQGISVFNSRQDLMHELRGMESKETIIVQEFIKGQEIPVEAVFSKGELIAYTVSEILTHDKGAFSYSTRRNYFANKELEKSLCILGKKMGINGFANLAYIYSPTCKDYYLIEADLRPNSWMSGKHVRKVFIEGIKRISAQISAKNRPIFTLNKRKIEVALFYKDIRRCLYNRDLKGLVRWISNYKYWQFLPIYDPRIARKMATELYKEYLNARLAKLTKYPAKAAFFLKPQTFVAVIKKQYASILNMTN